MRKLYFLLLFTTFCSIARSQNITVAGECMSNSILLNQITDVDGKVAYEGTGTVDGNAGVVIDVFWLPAPDSLWVLAFDGQPYFQNSCKTSAPPGTGNASCLWSAVSGQTCTGGTALIVAGSGVLPITISSFTANIDNNQVTLKWATSSENNNKGFEIQRSQDGVNWAVLGFVSGNGNSSVARMYQFIDPNPASSVAYYRLRQVDLDGKFNYSTTAAVRLLKSGFYSIIREAGNTGYQLNLDATAGKVDLLVFDNNGQRLISRSGVAGVQHVNLNNYPAGIYLLQIIKGSETFTEKLIKF